MNVFCKIVYVSFYWWSAVFVGGLQVGVPEDTSWCGILNFMWLSLTSLAQLVRAWDQYHWGSVHPCELSWSCFLWPCWDKAAGMTERAGPSHGAEGTLHICRVSLPMQISFHNWRLITYWACRLILLSGTYWIINFDLWFYLRLFPFLLWKIETFYK